MKRGHQLPPNGASTSETSTASAPALFSVLVRVASIMEKDADTRTMRSDRMMAASGDRPMSSLNASTPTVQKTAIWTRPFANVPVNIPARTASRLAELASRRSRVLNLPALIKIDFADPAELSIHASYHPVITKLAAAQ